MMNRNQPKTLYQVVSDSILEKIEAGEYAGGSRLPSESELCKIYQASRNTVRHALSDLVDKDVLVTVHGVGTFVQDNRIGKTTEHLYGFSGEMALHGKSVTSKVLDAKIINADPFLARRLHVQLGAEVVFLYRLRLLEGEPMAIERAYLPAQLFPGMLQFDFSNKSLYQVLSENYDMMPDHAEQEIGAEIATNEVARLLGLHQPAAVLVFHRETRSRDDRVIEYVDSEFRADQFEFYTHLNVNAGSQPMIFERLPVTSRQE